MIVGEPPLRKRFVTFALISIILVVATGCVDRTHEATQGVSSIQPLDRSKITAVKAKFAQDEILAGQSIKITVINMECTLEGTVPSEEVKSRAIRAAGSVEGISRVIDKLEIQVKE
jgi:hypothetical protein